MIWFTSDTHFNHENVIKYSSRPYKDLAEMTESLITTWNKKVQRGDTVYHLGDFALTSGLKDKDLVTNLLRRLNGQKFLITGNHDRDSVTKNTLWVSVKDYHEIKVDFGELHKQRIVMCHYAMRVWNQMHRGSWMVHGHSHGNLVDIGGKILDVGVDAHNYSPISVDEIASFMANREIISYDHHRVKSV